MSALDRLLRVIWVGAIVLQDKDDVRPSVGQVSTWRRRSHDNSCGFQSPSLSELRTMDLAPKS